ncbi:hypothetical protein JOC75_002639 [Metabacillus crassostreae]|nr:paeninodin family lasso peptide [Metabacillus crassostreae]MBM7604636.1 hypothetical protein [Metabacillus crassostreae]
MIRNGKKLWETPVLEELHIKYTAQGPGIRDVDLVFEDEDEDGYLSKS